MADTVFPDNVSDRPVIGISGGSPRSESVRHMMRQIEDAGGTPLLLTNHMQRDAARDIGLIDALVVMGNNADIDPAGYGQPRHAKTFSELDSNEGRARAGYEDAMIAGALAEGIPLLGVCAGMQRLNVHCGGTLHQHVPDLTGNDEHAQQNLGINFSTPVQPVLIEGGTTLGGIAGEVLTVFAPSHDSNNPTVMMENSMHHQAVDKVGNGLRPVAFAEDEITAADGSRRRLIEAVEADPAGPYGRQFVMGVQWHPEFGASELGPKLASHVVSEAHNYALAHQRLHAPEEIARENALSQQQAYELPSPPKDTAVRVREGSIAAMVMRGRAQTQERSNNVILS